MWSLVSASGNNNNQGWAGATSSDPFIDCGTGQRGETMSLRLRVESGECVRSDHTVSQMVRAIRRSKLSQSVVFNDLIC